MPYAPLNTPTFDRQVLLNRLVRMTSKTSGLSAIFMLAQYSSPLVVSLLLKLAEIRSRRSATAGKDLVRMAAGWTKVADGAADARIVMRSFGLLPIIQWLAALHPRPLAELRALAKGNPASVLQSSKWIPTIQALSLAVYYPAEHIWYLGSKGFLGLSPQSIGTAGKWLMQGWALYVVVEVYKIATQFESLRRRTARLKNTKRSVSVTAAEGYELQEGKSEGSTSAPASVDPKVEDEAVSKLKNDWEDWALNAAVYAGYAPLTAHWCTPGGLGPMKNGKVYAVLGTLTGLASVLTQWKAAA